MEYWSAVNYSKQKEVNQEELGQWEDWKEEKYKMPCRAIREVADAIQKVYAELLTGH